MLNLLKDRYGNFCPWRIAGTLVVGSILFGMTNPLVKINPGQRGVITRLGKVQPGVLNEGLHWRVPFIDDVTRINVRLQLSNVKGNGSSNDLQDVDIEVAVNWKITSDQVPEVFQELETEANVYERVLEPAVTEAFKAQAAQKTAEEIITARNDLKVNITNAITNEMKKNGITVTAVNIVDINFTEEFDKSIEAKQIAAQEAARAEFEKEARIARAEGEAQAAELEARALEAQGGNKVLQKEAIAKWNGNLPQTLILGGDGQGTLPQMILNSAANQ